MSIPLTQQYLLPNPLTSEGHLFFFFFSYVMSDWDRVSWSPDWSLTLYILNNPELLICLPLLLATGSNPRFLHARQLPSNPPKSQALLSIFSMALSSLIPDIFTHAFINNLSPFCIVKFSVSIEGWPSEKHRSSLKPYIKISNTKRTCCIRHNRSRPFWVYKFALQCGRRGRTAGERRMWLHSEHH